MNLTVDWWLYYMTAFPALFDGLLLDFLLYLMGCLIKCPLMHPVPSESITRAQPLRATQPLTSLLVSTAPASHIQEQPAAKPAPAPQPVQLGMHAAAGLSVNHNLLAKALEQRRSSGQLLQAFKPLSRLFHQYLMPTPYTLFVSV